MGVLGRYDRDQSRLDRGRREDRQRHPRHCPRLAYVAAKDFDWAYWPLNGTQGPGYGRAAGAEGGYGVLDTTWGAPANGTHLSQLQALQAATLTP